MLGLFTFVDCLVLQDCAIELDLYGDHLDRDPCAVRELSVINSEVSVRHRLPFILDESTFSHLFLDLNRNNAQPFDSLLRYLSGYLTSLSLRLGNSDPKTLDLSEGQRRLNV